MPELVFLRRGEEVLRFDVDRSRLLLGRSLQSDIVLPDAQVSLTQAAVLWDGAEVLLEDLSGEGTLVSGANSACASLTGGAEVCLGRWRMVLRPSRPPEASEPPAMALRWSARGDFARTLRIAGLPTAEGPSASASHSAAPGAPGRPSGRPALIGADPGIRQAAECIERIGASGVLVSIFGEAGSGRERVARAIHARSSRAEGPFIRVSCTGTEDQDFEAELFGREPTEESALTRRGALEEAAGGTLFLDDVGALSLRLQAKLLAVLESQTFSRISAQCPTALNARLLVATHRDLLSAMRGGAFREDLYERLCEAPLLLPPLRRRRGDVPALVEHFLKAFSPVAQPVRFTAPALARLSQGPWAGNLHELRAVVQASLLLRRGPTLEVGDFELNAEQPAGEFVPGLTLEQMLRLREREIVESALRRFDNNRERVARELGVARSTLFKRLKDWGLTKQDASPPPTSS